MAVYFVQEVGPGGMWIEDDLPVKIGYSNDASLRLLGLQTGSSVRLAVKALIPWGDKNLESAIHHTFRYHCIHGEWFRVDKDLSRFVAHYVRAGAIREQMYHYLSYITTREIEHNFEVAKKAYEERTGCKVVVADPVTDWTVWDELRYKLGSLRYRYYDFIYWYKFGRWQVPSHIRWLPTDTDL